MTKEEIRATFNPTLAEEFEVDITKITPEANIMGTLVFDSLSLVDLVAVVEYTFKVKISSEEMKTIKTFDDLYSFIENKQNK